MWVHVAMAGAEHGVPRDGHRPGVPPPRRPGAAPTAVVGPPRRVAAGHRRTDPAVVEVPAPLPPTDAVPVVLRDARRAPWCCSGLPLRLWRRVARSPRAAALLVRRACSASVSLPQALQRPDSTHLSWVTCVSFPLLILAVVEMVQAGAGRARRCASVVTAGARRGRCADVRRCAAVHVPLLPAAHAGQRSATCRRRSRCRATAVASTSATSGRTSASRDVIAELDRLSKPGRAAAGRAERPAPHVVQRRVLLLHVPRADAGDVLHRDGSRPRQRARARGWRRRSPRRTG